MTVNFNKLPSDRPRINYHWTYPKLIFSVYITNNTCAFHCRVHNIVNPCDGCCGGHQGRWLWSATTVVAIGIRDTVHGGHFQKTLDKFVNNRLQDVAANIPSEATRETRETLTALHAALKPLAVMTSTANHG